jgi:hypothetical protein
MRSDSLRFAATTLAALRSFSWHSTRLTHLVHRIQFRQAQSSGFYETDISQLIL